MRVVRCDACGAKAMIAAGQCPKCGHPFELRDGFGELLPLAYCSSCESYYPETVGSCRWCGTKPERPPIWPQVLRGVAVASAVGIVGTAWLLHDSGPREPLRARKTQAPKVASSPGRVDTVYLPRNTSAPAETRPDPIVGAPTTPDPSQPVVATTISPTPSLPQSPQPVVASSETLAPEPTPADAAPPVVAAEPRPQPAKSVASSPTATRQTKRWVRSVSRGWVVVRAGASKESRIVASIGPRSRVELGESVGSWRRIRARGLNGWVEPRNSFELLASR